MQHRTYESSSISAYKILKHRIEKSEIKKNDLKRGPFKHWSLSSTINCNSKPGRKTIVQVALLATEINTIGFGRKTFIDHKSVKKQPKQYICKSYSEKRLVGLRFLPHLLNPNTRQCNVWACAFNFWNNLGFQNNFGFSEIFIFWQFFLVSW